MKPANLLILMSDEHNARLMGCARDPIVRTPNLDRLAGRGTRYSAAYTASPICVPARAAFATGKYVHQMGYWDNVDAYDGAVRSWHHELRDRGHEAVSIGKLHFRGLPGDDHGFSREIVPMHIYQGRGDVKMLIRNPPLVRNAGAKLVDSAGPGESPYTVYDRDIAARAQIWLHEAARRRPAKPWVLFVSFVLPHFPLTAPPEHYYEYWLRELPLPKLYAKNQRPDHPYVRDYAGISNYDSGFKTAVDVKRAIAGYYGLVSTMDENVGRVLRALELSGLTHDTRVLYTSDHGDNVGARGLWGKSTMYEESAAVPLVLCGSGIPSGKVVSTPASHVDVYRFILDCVGIDEPFLLEGRPGEPLLDLPQDRGVLSEYHTVGSKSAVFMLRDAQHKYVHYGDGYPAQLFDLAHDPEEIEDLAGDPRHAGALASMRAKLLAMLDPLEVDQRAKRRQLDLLEKYGGAEAAMRAGDLGYTPAPGSTADFSA